MKMRNQNHLIISSRKDGCVSLKQNENQNEKLKSKQTDKQQFIILKNLARFTSQRAHKNGTQLK